MESLENAAVSVLKRAVELDQKHRWTEAMICYQEGLQLLLNAIKQISDARRREAFRAKASQYMDRVETLKKLIDDEKQCGKYREQIHIDEDSTGHGYEALFGRFLDATVTWVDVDDPYVRSAYQCQNFVRFCELLVKKCDGLRRVRLVTGTDSGKEAAQSAQLAELKLSLRNVANVELTVSVSDTLHDREIRFSNGWVVKIGRGLHYFKPPAGKFCLGANDMDLRQCQETTVDVFHKKSFLQSPSA